MRVAVVSTFPPRPCGIGTFSQDLRAALRESSPTIDVDIISIVREQTEQTDPDVLPLIRQDVRSDYPAVAQIVDSRGTDVVLVEHEYGIFGGPDGAYLLSLVQELSQPLVLTLHTVLSRPSVSQAETLRALCRHATLVTVFTETARRMVVSQRLVAPERIRVVPHGAPTILLPHSPSKDVRVAVGGPAAADTSRPAIERLEGRTVLSTFGLISEGKALEVAIRALPAVVAAHPEVLYLIAGQTHPEVVKREGEKYRLGLERLVRDLGLTDHVHFLDRFLTDEELAALLASTDIYLTPYRSREQIVSGALTFAVAAGCPVVSTPYYYAEDLLASGAGVLVPFDDSPALGRAVIDFLDDPQRLAAARTEARRVGAKLAWPAVGGQIMTVLREARELGPAGRRKPVAPASGPRLRPDHLLSLSDDVGIIQHARGVVPLRSSGYCVDDVARQVIVAIGMERSGDSGVYDRMLARGLAFLLHAFDPDTGLMRNFMGYDRQWLDEPHDGDHLGRTAWALGAVVAAHPPRSVRRPALDLLRAMADRLRTVDSLRAAALTVVGLTRPELDALPGDLVDLLRALSTRLLSAYRDWNREGWHWFEPTLTYDNARLPQALIAAGERLGDSGMVDAGLEALQWYADECGLAGEHVRLVGNRWRSAQDDHDDPDLPVGDSPPSEGDEQPLDASALAEAFADARRVTGDEAHGVLAVRSLEWFYGRNRLGVPVYDFATGGCHDGLGDEALNDNEGAESTLAFLQALLELENAGLQSSLPPSSSSSR
ncbi:glycosyltransferase family 4 protein [Nakamurella flavida]|uniref:Glycosyltransferase family 4 protein n=1 Tax=Nakamurella flavida TaxID=363630 RepID=A0A939C420_9ACTN|nr:glycosyltransferase family 4 protein [Nakamurella flavida]MBM9475214.1 glycosyltransferase family 4 protein [Nakamurella flavida]MDP9776787.1 glycosyltransferase involved in cell wall biosynthesis [Nakamurella flavida]